MNFDKVDTCLKEKYWNFLKYFLKFAMYQLPQPSLTDCGTDYIGK